MGELNINIVNCQFELLQILIKQFRQLNAGSKKSLFDFHVFLCLVLVISPVSRVCRLSAVHIWFVLLLLRYPELISMDQG